MLGGSGWGDPGINIPTSRTCGNSTACVCYLNWKPVAPPPPPPHYVDALRALPSPLPPPPPPPPPQGRIQELKGEGPKLNMYTCENFTLGHAHFGVLRGMPNWRGKARHKIDHGCTQGVLGKDLFPPRGARKKNSVNYTNCIRTIDCLCSKSTLL